MRENLIKILDTHCDYAGHVDCKEDCTECLANHLIANGVTVLPCKIGDTVWGIRYHTGVPYIKQGVVSERAYLDDMRLAIAVKFAPKYNTRGFWGVNIFATREECVAEVERRSAGHV